MPPGRQQGHERRQGVYGSAESINDRGDIVGWEWRPNNRSTIAVIWQKNRWSLSLDNLLDPVSGEGWHLHRATGINRSGQIVGWGTHNGERRIFLLTPMD